MVKVPQYFANIISSLDKVLVVYTVETVTGGWKLTTRCTHWLTVNSTVVLDSVEYVVKSFEQDSYLVVSGISEPTVGRYTISNPYFIHGKLQATQSQMSKVDIRSTSLFIWLLEPFQLSRPEDPSSMIEQEGQLRFFLMNNTNYSDYLTADDYTNVIYPLQSLASSFYNKIYKSRNVTDAIGVQYINHSRFNTGLEAKTSQTQDKSMFGRYLSGIEMRVTLQFRKSLICNC